jgi:hypothetical protein
VTTRVTWVTMKVRNQASTRKCRERAAWMLNIVLTRRKRADGYSLGMAREGLAAGADDEDQEEQVEDMLPAHPGGQSAAGWGRDGLMIPASA